MYMIVQIKSIYIPSLQINVSGWLSHYQVLARFLCQPACIPLAFHHGFPPAVWHFAGDIFFCGGMCRTAHVACSVLVFSIKY